MPVRNEPWPQRIEPEHTPPRNSSRSLISAASLVGRKRLGHLLQSRAQLGLCVARRSWRPDRRVAGFARETCSACSGEAAGLNRLRYQQTSTFHDDIAKSTVGGQRQGMIRMFAGKLLKLLLCTIQIGLLATERPLMSAPPESAPPPADSRSSDGNPRQPSRAASRRSRYSSANSIVTPGFQLAQESPPPARRPRAGAAADQQHRPDRADPDHRRATT